MHIPRHTRIILSCAAASLAWLALTVLALTWLVVNALALPGCATVSVPTKQQAVVSLAASENALETAHNAERLLCSPGADQTKPITHCDGPLVAQLGLTDDRHRQLASIFARAFDVEVKAATAMKAWHPGEAAPPGLSEYQVILSELLRLVMQVVPNTAVSAKTQEATAAADRAAAAIGGR